MEPRAHHILIGLFTVVVAISAVLFALWLSKSRQHDVSSYTVVFSEPVRGLSRGSTVQYNGIKVGEVSAVTLNPDKPGEVRAVISVDSAAPIRQNTQAKLAQSGLTGVALLELTGGSSDSPALQPGPDGTPALIQASPSTLNQLFANSDQLLSDVIRLVNNAQQFLTPENAGHVRSTLRGADELVIRLNEVAVDAGSSLRELASVLRTTDKVIGTDAVAAIDAARNAMASIQNAGRQAGSLLQSNRESINEGAQGLTEIGPALRELRLALGTLRTILRRIEDNPAGYLLGRERMQEFQP
ncbi:MAG: MlaD family protein [Burkholderiaceae bacterium]|jgi:phospholipid/cholesterol/gamma-HCH transport system substrate-binding protein